LITSRIEGAGERLAAVEDTSQEVEEQLQSAMVRHGGESASGEGGAAPLVRLKESLQRMRREIRDMDMGIHMVSASLLALRVSDRNNALATARVKHKQRHSKSKHIESIDSDELYVSAS
jgi:hypothetical protein